MPCVCERVSESELCGESHQDEKWSPVLKGMNEPECLSKLPFTMTITSCGMAHAQTHTHM